MKAAVSLGAVVVLTVIALEDLRRFRIRNGFVGLLFALSLGHLVGSPLPVIAAHMAAALLALAVLSVVFAVNGIGGGDVKLMVVALFWIGPEGLSAFAVFLLAFALLSCGAAAAGAMPSRQSAGRTKIPFGPSVAGAWTAVIAAEWA